MVLVTAAALTAAAAVVSGAGELWADAAAAVVRPGAYHLLALGVSITVFVTAVWAGDVVQGLLDAYGWAAAFLSVFAILATGPVTAAALVLALSAATAQALSGHGPAEPAWLSASDLGRPVGPPRLVQTLATGVAAGATAAIAQSLLEERRRIEQLVTTVDQGVDISSAERAAEIRGDIIPALQVLRGDADAVRPEDADVQRVHMHLLTSLRTAITAFTDLADGLKSGDQTVFRRGQGEGHDEATKFKAWVDGLRGLYGGGG